MKKLRAIKKEQIKINEQYDAAKKILEKYEKQLKDTKNNTEFRKNKKRLRLYCHVASSDMKTLQNFVRKL